MAWIDFPAKAKRLWPWCWSACLPCRSMQRSAVDTVGPQNGGEFGATGRHLAAPSAPMDVAAKLRPIAAKTHRSSTPRTTLPLSLGQAERIPTVMSTLFNCRDEEDGQLGLHGDFRNPEMRYDRNLPTGLSRTAASEPKPRQFRRRSGGGAARPPRLDIRYKTLC